MNWFVFLCVFSARFCVAVLLKRLARVLCCALQRSRLPMCPLTATCSLPLQLLPRMTALLLRPRRCDRRLPRRSRARRLVCRLPLRHSSSRRSRRRHRSLPSPLSLMPLLPRSPPLRRLLDHFPSAVCRRCPICGRSVTRQKCVRCVERFPLNHVLPGASSFAYPPRVDNRFSSPLNMLLLDFLGCLFLLMQAFLSPWILLRC